MKQKKLNKKLYKKAAILLLLLFMLWPIASEALISPGYSKLELETSSNALSATAILGSIAKFGGYLTNKVIELQNKFIRIEAVKTAWEIFRNFSNMFFILLLLLTAFGTIFNIQKYKASNLLPKIIIAALIINFSYIITILIIDALYFPAEMFQSAIGNMLSEKMADSLQIVKVYDTSMLDMLFPQISGVKTIYNTLTGITFNNLIISFFNMIILIIVDFIFLWIALVLLVRIPVLMGLAIISPIAWLSYAFPGIKHIWQKWWQQIIHWGLLPLFYLAVIYFGLFFNREIKLIMNSISPEDQKIISWWPMTLNNTILFFINVGILIGGLVMAHKFAKSSGLWGYNAAGVLTFGYTGGAARLWQRVKKEGVRIPGTEKRVLGAEQKEKREITAERRLGRVFGQMPFASLEAQKTKLQQAEKLVKQLNEQLASKKFKSIAEKQSYIKKELKRSRPGTDRHLALLMQSSKEGIIDNESFDQAIKSYGRQRLVINKLISMMKEKDFASIDPKFIFKKMETDENLRTNLEVRRMFYQYLSSKPSTASKTISDKNDYKIAFEVLGGNNTTEGKRFESELAKIMPTIVAQAKAERNNTKPTEELKEIMRKLSLEQIAKLPKKEWQESEFTTALRSHILSLDKDRQADTLRDLQKLVIKENRTVLDDLRKISSPENTVQKALGET